MSLKDSVDEILTDQQRSLSWLATELGKTFTGFKLSLINESIKYSDLKKMAEILKIPITMVFEGDTTFQSIKGKRNTQASHSYNVAEPELIYKKEVDLLKEQVKQLKDQLNDKEMIIRLLKKE